MLTSTPSSSLPKPLLPPGRTRRLEARLHPVDEWLSAWLARHSIPFLRFSLGIIFLWFGALKLVPGLSPAQDLATRTIGVLSFRLLSPDVALRLLAGWECLIGVGLLSGRLMRVTLALLFLQMMGTITPFFLFPEEIFTRFPYGLTFEGQYIVKNLVLIAAGLVLGAGVSGCRFVAGSGPE